MDASLIFFLRFVKDDRIFLLTTNPASRYSYYMANRKSVDAKSLAGKLGCETADLIGWAAKVDGAYMLIDKVEAGSMQVGERYVRSGNVSAYGNTIAPSTAAKANARWRLDLAVTKAQRSVDFLRTMRLDDDGVSMESVQQAEATLALAKERAASEESLKQEIEKILAKRAEMGATK